MKIGDKVKVSKVVGHTDLVKYIGQAGEIVSIEAPFFKVRMSCDDKEFLALRKEIDQFSNYSSHYDWLDVNFPIFLKDLNIDGDYRGFIRAHGDKCYSYKGEMNKNNIHFFHGVAIYLLTYIDPYSKEVREVDGDWIHPMNWVIANKDKFMPYLPSI
jgi:hypothetical protein